VQRAQNFLNEQLYDHDLHEAHALVREELALSEAQGDCLRIHALEICRQALPGTDMKVHVEGATHLVEQPEFADLDKLRAVLRALDDKAALFRLLDRVLDGQGVQVVLGAHEVPGLACVGTAISTLSTPAGAITLMGPLRMDYGRLVPMVAYALRLFTGYCESV
jgi:heat-inducible transcriptional repressor